MTFKDLEKKFQPIIQIIKEKGGHLIFVGGCVRDILANITPKDFDAEVYNLSSDDLLTTLEKMGNVRTIGKKFGIFYLAKYKIEIALPRLEQKTSKGHKGFDIKTYPTLSFREASIRRDLTINSMGWDPETKELLDPWDGQKDLKSKTLRATSLETFGEDPLRALRVAQFAARFKMHPDATLKNLCATQDLSELSMDRLLGEFKKLLVMGIKPSYGIRFLIETNLMRFFADIRPTDFIIEALDAAVSYTEKDFAFMLALLMIETPLPQVEYFFEIINLPKETKGVVQFLHSLKNSFYQNLKNEDEDEGYAYRLMAAKCYEEPYTPHKFLMLLKLGLGLKDGQNKADSYKAFDRRKIQPIIKGKHLLKWCPSIKPKEFSKILDACHTIQLKEELYEEQLIWDRFQKSLREKERM
jgi:tRNA nucleotidyltransferase/poly(A) polymerase